MLLPYFGQTVSFCAYRHFTTAKSSRQFLRACTHSQMNRCFYKALVESVVTTDIINWYPGTRNADKDRLDRVVSEAGKITRVNFLALESDCQSRARKKLKGILYDLSHPLNSCTQFLPSGKRLRTPRTRTQRHRNAFIPHVISLFNS